MLRFKNVSFLEEENGLVKTVVTTTAPAFGVRLCVDGREYADEFNGAEPYDRLAHVFHVEGLTEFAQTPLELKCRDSFGLKRTLKKTATPVFQRREDVLKKYDSGIEIKKETVTEVWKGLRLTVCDCEDRFGAPVKAFALEADMNRLDLYIGTPGDGYRAARAKATVHDMALSARAHGHNVKAAVNADFFDIFGDCHPSGLCVKNGVVISEGEKNRRFIGVTRDGRAVIGSPDDDISDIYQAASGLEQIVKDGEIHDFAPLEPFSYVRHPRTAAGIADGNKIITVVVDGRIPEYSGGATLVDLAKLMLRFGAKDAINLDGGGSSVTYIDRKGPKLVLQNRPADLFRPRANLIRREFNCLLFCAKPFVKQ